MVLSALLWTTPRPRGSAPEPTRERSLVLDSTEEDSPLPGRASAQRQREDEESGLQRDSCAEQNSCSADHVASPSLRASLAQTRRKQKMSG